MGIITGHVIGSSGPAALPVPTVGQVVENVVALRALLGSVDLPAVTLMQYSGSTLIGGGVFEWRATAATDDSGHRFNAGGHGSSGAGWQRVDVTPGEYRGENYGIIPDGVSNNDAAWARLYAAAAGARILLPGGVINIPGGITVSDDGTLLCGQPTTVLLRDSGTVLTFSGTMTGGGAKDITISGATTAARGVDIEDAHRLTLTNIRVSGVTTVGLRIRNSVLPAVHNFSCSTAVGPGMPTTGMLLDTDGTLGVYAAQITEPTIEGCGTGIDVAAGLYNKIRGGTVEACSSRGIRFGSGTGLSSVSDVHMEGNGTEGDLRIAGSQIQVLNCQCLSNVATQRGVYFATTSQACAVVGGVVSVVEDVGTRNALILSVSGAVDVSGATTPHLAYLDTAGAHALTWPGYTHSDTGVSHTSGAFNPENNVAAPPGSTHAQTNGAPGGVLWIKETGTGDTGWIALPASTRQVYSGDGPPDGVVDGTRGKLYVDTGTLSIPGEGTLYVATQASGDTGWVPVGAANATATGSRTYVTDQWHIQYRRLQLTSTQRLTLAGTARYIITDL